MPEHRVQGIRLHVEVDDEAGDAPWVVMLHGALAAHQAFRSQRTALRSTWRLAVPDLRGHGLSTHLGEPGCGWDTMTIGQLAEDVRELADQLSPSAPVHLVGVSMGGLTAAQVAARWPSRVASLALVSTSGYFSDKRRRYFSTITPETLPLSTQRLSAKWHGEPYWRDLARHLFAHFAAPTGERYPPALSPPRALVLQATDDEILEVDEHEAWSRRIRAPVRVERPPGDHAFFADGREGSQAANRALRSFLSGIQ